MNWNSALATAQLSDIGTATSEHRTSATSHHRLVALDSLRVNHGKGSGRLAYQRHRPRGLESATMTVSSSLILSR